MSFAQVVETSVKVTTNIPSQDYTHLDDHNLCTYYMTTGFKPFTDFSGWPLNEKGKQKRKCSNTSSLSLQQFAFHFF